MAAAVDDVKHLRRILSGELQVMLYRQDRYAPVLIQMADKGIQLQLALDVDARRRLVKNEQIGLAHEGPGNEHLLALAARQVAYELVL